MARTAFRVFRRTPADWLGIAKAYGYLLRATAGLYLFHKDLTPLLKRSRASLDEPSSTNVNGAFADKAARYIDIASRHPFLWARCLQRSMALCMWLDSRGFRPALRIGIRKNGSKLEAHAWVEHGEQVLNDSPIVEKEFTRLKSSQQS